MSSHELEDEIGTPYLKMTTAYLVNRDSSPQKQRFGMTSETSVPSVPSVFNPSRLS